MRVKDLWGSNTVASAIKKNYPKFTYPKSPNETGIGGVEDEMLTSVEAPDQNGSAQLHKVNIYVLGVP